jgi:UDP-N-acetylmuramate-alanine ligase
LGVHNVRNALAAIAVGSRLGISVADLQDGLRAFKGIKRRLEVVGRASGGNDPG